MIWTVFHYCSIIWHKVNNTHYFKEVKFPPSRKKKDDLGYNYVILLITQKAIDY